MKVFPTDMNANTIFPHVHLFIKWLFQHSNTSLCSLPQWFCQSSALDTEDSLEKQKVFKFRGDLACRQRKYKVLNITSI